MTLPPFPVDEVTLAQLEAAMDPWGHGHPNAAKSCLWEFLDLMSELGGSDLHAVEEQVLPPEPLLPGFEGASVVVMRDPRYSDHCVIQALIDEVRRLRQLVGASPP